MHVYTPRLFYKFHCSCDHLTQFRGWFNRHCQGKWQWIHQDGESHDQGKLPGVGRYAAHWPLSCLPEPPHHSPLMDVNTQQNSNSELEYKHMQGKKKKWPSKHCVCILSSHQTLSNRIPIVYLYYTNLSKSVEFGLWQPLCSVSNTWVWDKQAITTMNLLHWLTI